MLLEWWGGVQQGHNLQGRSTHTHTHTQQGHSLREEVLSHTHTHTHTHTQQGHSLREEAAPAPHPDAEPAGVGAEAAVMPARWWVKGPW